MATFSYEAADRAGRLVKGSMEAMSADVLVKRLRDQGYLPIDIKESAEARGAAPLTLRPFSRRPGAGVVASFTHGLATMLEAGVPLDRALSILSELETDVFLRSIIREIKKGLEGGRTLADCLQRRPDVFPPIYTSTIRAGEAGGNLEEALRQVNKYMEDSQRLKDELRSALLYPLILTVAGGLAVAVMVVFVVPRFSVIFDGMGGAMPLPTKMLLAMSEAVKKLWWAPVLLAAAIYLWLKARLRTPQGRLSFDKAVQGLPMLGPVSVKASVSRFSRTLGMLLRSGLPILDSLSIAVSTMGNAFMAKGIEPVIDGVRRGRGMALPLKEAGVFPPLAVHMIAIGEETGRLDEMLLKLSDNYDREIAVRLKRLLTLLEPAVILLMAGVVGFIVISLLMAVFSLNDLPL